VLGLALLFAGLGWLFASSRPRLHPAAPDPADVPARLLATAGYETVLWLPYPHQNLGRFEQLVADPEAWLGALATVTGAGRLSVPRFGPFAVPPARELAVAVDGEGRPTVAARVSWALAAFARLSGKVAGNPWLAGGEIESGGARLRVTWQGSLWRVEPSAGAPPLAAAGATLAPALAYLRLTADQPPAPRGLYRLTTTAGGLELVGGRPPVGPTAAELAGLGATVGSLERVAGGARGVLLFEQGGFKGLPGAVALARGDAERPDLPGEKILSFLGALPAGEAQGWRITATDPATRDAALAGSSTLAALERRGDAALVWADPARAHALTAGIARTLGQIPLLRRRDVEAWRSWATLLEPLAPCRSLRAAFGAGEGEARVELVCS
jgi:hypothetical protein